MKYPLNVNERNVKLHNLTENSSAIVERKMHYPKMAKTHFQLEIYSVFSYWHKLVDEKL